MDKMCNTCLTRSDIVEQELRARIAELEAMVDTDSEGYGIVANTQGWELIKSMRKKVADLTAPPSDGEIAEVGKALYMNANMGAGLSEEDAQRLWVDDENRDAWFGQAKAAIETFMERRR